MLRRPIASVIGLTSNASGNPEGAERPVQLERLHIGRHRVALGHGVDDEIDTPGLRLHLLLVCRQHDLVRAHRVGELDGEVPKSPDTDPADRLPGTDVPMAER
jgi:hypothetical protein